MDQQCILFHEHLIEILPIFIPYYWFTNHTLIVSGIANGDIESIGSQIVLSILGIVWFYKSVSDSKVPSRWHQDPTTGQPPANKGRNAEVVTPFHDGGGFWGEIMPPVLDLEACSCEPVMPYFWWITVIVTRDAIEESPVQTADLCEVNPVKEIGNR